MCGREEGRGVERRAEGRGVSEEEGEGEGRAEEGSNSWKSSHWPSFIVRSVLLWKVYLPEKKIVTSNSSLCRRWAMAEGIGAHLISKPELVCDMVHSARHGSQCMLSQWTSSLHQNPCA